MSPVSLKDQNECLLKLKCSYFQIKKLQDAERKQNLKMEVISLLKTEFS